MDPDATEEDVSIYEQSGVSLTCFHGVFYTPPGFKKSARNHDSNVHTLRLLQLVRIMISMLTLIWKKKKSIYLQKRN